MIGILPQLYEYFQKRQNRVANQQTELQFDLAGVLSPRPTVRLTSRHVVHKRSGLSPFRRRQAHADGLTSGRKALNVSLSCHR